MVERPFVSDDARHANDPRRRKLLTHRLLSFSRTQPENRWHFSHVDGRSKETLTFQPYLFMNDYAGIASALLGRQGIGELPPLVQPHLLHRGPLVEVMPKWRFPSFDLSVVHLDKRHMARVVGVFKEFAARMAPALFPKLPE